MSPASKGMVVRILASDIEAIRFWINGRIPIRSGQRDRKRLAL